jgi:hypothetical protein
MRAARVLIPIVLLSCTSGASETIRPPDRRCSEAPACVRGTVWDDNLCRCVAHEAGLPTCTFAAHCEEGLEWSAVVCGCIPTAAAVRDASHE